MTTDHDMADLICDPDRLGALADYADVAPDPGALDRLHAMAASAIARAWRG